MKIESLQLAMIFSQALVITRGMKHESLKLASFHPNPKVRRNKRLEVFEMAFELARLERACLYLADRVKRAGLTKAELESFNFKFNYE
jgi:hypothetical protein